MTEDRAYMWGCCGAPIINGEPHSCPTVEAMTIVTDSDPEQMRIAAEVDRKLVTKSTFEDLMRSAVVEAALTSED